MILASCSTGTVYYSSVIGLTVSLYTRQCAVPPFCRCTILPLLTLADRKSVIEYYENGGCIVDTSVVLLLIVSQERKRWYILRRDLAQGYCLLEYYKDEKAAAKGANSIKGFINVHDVVDVRRVAEKKQTFEILCPGVGYRLMANSEVEADEWTDALKKLILYRKDNLKTHSLQRPTSPPADNLEPVKERKRTLSDSAQQPIHSHHLLSHPSSLAIPTSSHSNTTDIPTINLPHSLPTPPEMTGAPSFPSSSYPPPQQQQQQQQQQQTQSKSALEIRAVLPSPSTSSDSSSMCSGSNASFENQSTFEGERPDSRKACL